MVCWSWLTPGEDSVYWLSCVHRLPTPVSLKPAMGAVLHHGNQHMGKSRYFSFIFSFNEKAAV